jgi:hypothetical protein
VHIVEGNKAKDGVAGYVFVELDEEDLPKWDLIVDQFGNARKPEGYFGASEDKNLVHFYRNRFVNAVALPDSSYEYALFTRFAIPVGIFEQVNGGWRALVQLEREFSVDERRTTLYFENEEWLKVKVDAELVEDFKNLFTLESYAFATINPEAHIERLQRFSTFKNIQEVENYLIMALEQFGGFGLTFSESFMKLLFPHLPTLETILKLNATDREKWENTNNSVITRLLSLFDENDIDTLAAQGFTHNQIISAYMLGAEPTLAGVLAFDDDSVPRSYTESLANPEKYIFA